jgi:hypothetical protein
MVWIYGQEETTKAETTIALQIFLCTQIKIIQLKDIPALICPLCLNDLSQFMSFRLNAQKSNEFFLKLASSKEQDAWRKSCMELRVKSENNITSTAIKIETFEDTFNYESQSDNEINDAILENVGMSCYTEKPMATKTPTKTNDEVHPCTQIGCEKSFKIKNYLTKHLFRVHSIVHPKNSGENGIKVENQRFVCDVDACGKNFKEKNYMMRHIKVHHLKTSPKKQVKDEPLPCDVCGKIIRNRGLLKTHLRSHQKMTPNDYFYCDLCPRKFKTKGGCSWHIKQRHILKTTFKCTYCPAIYKVKWVRSSVTKFAISLY